MAEQKASNIHVRDGVTEDEFVAMRQARDTTLEVPALILHSIQVNVGAGHLSSSDENGGLPYLESHVDFSRWMLLSGTRKPPERGQTVRITKPLVALQS